MAQSLSNFDFGAVPFDRCGQFRTQSLAQLRFYQILLAYSKRYQVRLNMPDTLIQGFGIKKPTWLRTSPQGFLTSRSGLSSPEYPPTSIIAFLLVLSSHTKPGLPCAIVKQEAQTRDVCMPLMTLKAGQIAWNRMLGQTLPVLIQRFVYNGSPCAFLLRVRVQPSLNHTAYKILQNVQSVRESPGEDHYTELNLFLNQPGRKLFPETKARKSVAERLCVRSSTLPSFEFCSIACVESVRVQVETLKTVLERGYLAERGLSVLELEADFIQGNDAKWYFVSLHSYRTEVTVQRSLPKVKAGELIVRLLPRVASAPSLLPRVLDTHTLAQEIFADLRRQRCSRSNLKSYVS